MDPDVNLEEQRRIVVRISLNADLNADPRRDAKAIIAEGIRLAELVEALDGWILKGGFLPRDWRVKR